MRNWQYNNRQCNNSSALRAPGSRIGKTLKIPGDPAPMSGATSFQSEREALTRFYLYTYRKNEVSEILPRRGIMFTR
jgi:hypothetical protein